MSDSLGLDLLKLVGVILLILGNAFFVAAEFALVSVRKTRIAELVQRGVPAARWVERAIQDPDRFVAATQLGITLCSLGLGWIAEPALAHWLEPILSFIPGASRSTVSHGLSAALAFLLITFLVVVVGELTPKSVALHNPDATALAVARPTAWAEALFMPAIWLLNGAAALLLRAFGLKPATRHELAHSVEELKMLVTASAESGVVEDEEEEMVHAVFEFGDMIVRQVMVPRTEVIAVPAEAALQTLVDTVVEHPFTKLPVYEADLDHVIGIVHLKDIMRASHTPVAPAPNARALMRSALFIPEAAPLSSLLNRLRSRHEHMAIVIDEYGGMAGVVTLEDLIEEIVGEVSDEADEPPKIRPLSDGTSLVDGMTLIEEVNEHFNLTLRDANYDTLAGYVLGRLGRMPHVGDTLEVAGTRLRVEALDGLRISQLSLTPPPAPGTPSVSDVR